MIHMEKKCVKTGDAHMDNVMLLDIIKLAGFWTLSRFFIAGLQPKAPVICRLYSTPQNLVCIRFVFELLIRV